MSIVEQVRLEYAAQREQDLRDAEKRHEQIRRATWALWAAVAINVLAAILSAVALLKS